MAEADEDLRGALLAAERDADQSFASEPAGSPVMRCPLGKHWVEFSLFDGDDPVGDVRYRVTLPSGRVEQGTLNGRGRVRIEQIAEGGACSIAFPELDAMAGPGEGGGATSGEAPEGDGLVYTPGAPPSLPLDAAYRFDVPDWELIELESEGREGEGEAGGVGGSDEGDWALVELDLVDTED